ncbi:MAG: class I SAM-dependent methyltransferase [Candidatus Omnitrophica bacterium]|nr:class I SAM-dependent methyltransferase [Candidatus Omnitrophota bacterium]
MKTLFRKLRHIISLLIGMIICKSWFLKTYKYHLLSSWQIMEKRKGIDHLLYPSTLNFWIKYEYLSEVDPDKREASKKILMGEDGGRAWAKTYDSQPLDFNEKIGSLTYDEACPLLTELDKKLNSISKPALIVQIGSSSGREIAWLAKRNTEHKYIGTDIYAEVIDYSANSHNLPNLSFQICSAKEIYDILSICKKQKIFVFSSGSLQYVQPEHMKTFFNSISQIPELEIILLEPANELKKNPEEIKGSVWRGNLSYTHNYRFYAEKAGFITKKCRIIKPYFPYERSPVIHNGTVLYYYWGIAKS